MTRFIRAALYAVSSKPSRETIVKVISGILCMLFIPTIIFSGFATTYLSVYGGTESNDVFSQAVMEVKNELSIENNLEPSILRAIYYKMNNTLDIPKDDIIQTIKTYFVKSQKKERTVTQEDLDLITEEIEKLDEQIQDEESKKNKNTDLIAKLIHNKAELSKKLEEAQKVFDSEKDVEYSFLEMEEIKQKLKSSPFNFDDNFLKEIENYVLYIGSHITVDFSDITFENEVANDIQKKIVMVAVSASQYGINAKYNQCEAWVADVYQKVLGIRGYAPSAVMAGRIWSVSTDWSKIQIGAAVYGTASQQYGHVGIYIGNGLVIHNLSGKVKTESLESWVKSYNGKCWGWENAQNLTGNPLFNCVGGMI